MEGGSAAVLRCGGEVRCVALGAGALAAGVGTAVRLWRAGAPGHWAAVAAKPGAHRYGVTGVAWGARLLASGGVDGAVRLWGGDLRGVALLGAPGAAAVRSLCWSGSRLAVGHDDGALRVWASTGAQLASLRPHEDALTSLCAPAAALLVTAAADGVMKVYDFNEVCSSPEVSPVEWKDSAHDLGALCAAAAPHAPVAATAGHDARIRIWTMTRTKDSWLVQSGGVLLGHSGAVSSLSWAGDLLASASHDRTARLWRLTNIGVENVEPDDPAGTCIQVLHAHMRYLTAVAIDFRQRFLVTGSSDKTLRVWLLGDTKADDELQPLCEPTSHFGLGDLEGIEPIADDELLDLDSMASSDSGHEEEDDEWCGGMNARRVYSMKGNGIPINCLCSSGTTLASAASDGSLQVWTWRKRRLRQLIKLTAHEYPALCVALPMPVLLSAGLDGVMKLWDIETGSLLRAVAASGSERVGEEAGSGVRGVAVTRRGGAGGAAGWRALLASDSGTAQLWRLADDAPQPDAIYNGFNAACACVAWSGCGRVCAGGGAGGELRIWAPHKETPEIASNTDAHDLGVQAIGWSSVLSTGSSRVLGSIGADLCLKLWTVEWNEDSPKATLELVATVEAHCGAADTLSWQPHEPAVNLDDVTLGQDDNAEVSALVATGGSDRWARVWRVQRRGGGGRVSVGAAHAAHLRNPVLSLAFLPPDHYASADESDAESPWYLAVGTLVGGVSVWSLGAAGAAAQGADVPRHWGTPAVRMWAHDYVTAVPGSPATIEEECHLLERIEELQATGAWLLDSPIEEVLEQLEYLTYGPELQQRLVDELHWLRRPPHPHILESRAPHHLLCPLGHTLLRDPVRAADGFSYDRAALADHFLIEGAAVSGVTGRRMSSGRVLPNRRLRTQLRDFLVQHEPVLYADLVDTPEGTSTEGDL